jgi:acyl carrier protein
LLTTEQLQDTLTEIFQEVFADDTLVFRPDLTARDVDGWDSLTHIRLMVTVERKFKIKFTITEVGGLKDAGELMKLIQSKTGAQDK